MNHKTMTFRGSTRSWTQGDLMSRRKVPVILGHWLRPRYRSLQLSRIRVIISGSGINIGPRYLTLGSQGRHLADGTSGLTLIALVKRTPPKAKVSPQLFPFYSSTKDTYM